MPRGAGVAELADALDSKSGSRKGVGVRAPPPVPNSTHHHPHGKEWDTRSGHGARSHAAGSRSVNPAGKLDRVPTLLQNIHNHSWTL